jgi:D-3-phosphoglycerate dehydrogenase
MKRFKVALVSVDAPEVPNWVCEEIADGDVDLVIRDCKEPEEVIEVAHDADVVWVFGGGRVVTAECLPELKECIAVLRSGSGTDNIPVIQATELGILVANTPQATCETVSDHAVALLLSLVRKIVSFDKSVRKGAWTYRDTTPPSPFQGKVLGLIGFGFIARRVAEKLSGFDLSYVAYDPFVDEEVFRSFGVLGVSLEELLETSDYISIHCPLKADTHHLIDERALRRMKPGALLVNTARGAIIDEKILLRAIKEGWIGGAALDVLETPPNGAPQPLLDLDNVILTPHMAGYVEDHLKPFWEHSVRTILDLANGRLPSSYVNPEVKPRKILLEVN